MLDEPSSLLGRVNSVVDKHHKGVRNVFLLRDYRRRYA